MFRLHKHLVVYFVLLVVLINTVIVFAEEMPLTVSQAVQLALTENVSLKNLQVEVEQVNNQLVEYNDQFYPQINISGDAEYTYVKKLDGQLHIVPTMNWQLDPKTNLQVLIGVNWPNNNPLVKPLVSSIKMTRTLRGGEQTWQAGLDAKEFERLTKEIQLKQNQDSISYQVIKGYYEVVKSMKMVEVQKEAVKRSEGYLNQTQAFYEAGQVAKLDFLNAQVQLSQDQFALKRAEDSLNLARMQLNLLLGVDLETEFIFEADFELIPIRWTEEEAIRIASERSPQIEIYNQQYSLKLDEAQRIKNKNLPTLNLEGGYQWEDTKINDGAASLKLMLNYSPTTSRSTQYSLKNNQLDQEKIQRQITNEMTRLTLEVKAKYASLNSCLNELSVQEDLVQKVKDNLEIALVRYQAGLTTGNEILDLQINLLKAEKSYYETMVNYLLTITELSQLLGERF